MKSRRQTILGKDVSNSLNLYITRYLIHNVAQNEVSRFCVVFKKFQKVEHRVNNYFEQTTWVYICTNVKIEYTLARKYNNCR